MKLFAEQKQAHKVQKQTYDYQMEMWGRRNELGVWDSYIHTTMYKADNH